MNKTVIRPLVALLIFLMPVVSSLGSVITVAGLAAARPLAAVLFISALIGMKRWNNVATFVLLLSCIWLVWGLLNLHNLDGIKKLFSIAMGLATVLAFLIYPWTRKRLRILARSWLFAWVFAVIPALYEIATGNHLPNYLSSSPEWTRLNSTDVASYFVNPNPFAYFLCASMIVFSVGSRLEEGRLRLVLLACCFVTPLLITQTDSRAVLAVSLLVLLWVVLTVPPFKNYVRCVVSIVAGAAVASLALLVLSPSLVERILDSFQGSGSDRLKLYQNAVWMFHSSYGIGIGPGMFEPTMKSGMVPYVTTGAINPHSGIFEVLSQYGFLISAILGAGLIALAVKGLPGFTQNIDDEGRRMILQGSTATALALPLLSFGDSTFLDSPIAWVQIATTLAFFHAQRTIEPSLPRSSKLNPHIEQRMQIIQRLS